MIDEILRLAWLFTPLVGGAIVHGVVMRQNWFSSLTKPIDFGAVFRGKRIFGPNKTFRGILVNGAGTALFMGLQATVFHESFQAYEYFDYAATNCWLLGFILGVASMLSELPNSFVKRQLDVPSGSTASGFLLPIFYVIDQIDLLVGSWIVLAFVMDVTVERVLLSLIIVIVIHQLINFIGYALGMRKTLR